MELISVLLAARSAASRTLLESSLTDWGYQVTSAADGEAAQLLLQATRFDICILDWELPDMSGLEICRRLRANQPDAGSFVILVASQAHVEAVLEEAQRQNETSANGYIMEPVDLRHLRHRLAGLAQLVIFRRDVRTESVKKIDWTGGPAFS
jgi:CheY-like chemotaxis protein